MVKILTSLSFTIILWLQDVKNTVTKTVDKAEEHLENAVQKDIFGWGSIQDFLTAGPYINKGQDNEIHFQVWMIVLIIVAFITTSFLLRLFRKFYTRKLDDEDKDKFVSVFSFLKYFIYVIVIIITLNSAGVKITALLAASAALLVGFGLALQELFQDVIGGIFIVTDKSLHVGDIIEIEGRVGRVLEIKLRTTRAVTRDDKVIIIPNHKFISDTIFNYTQNHKTTRESVKVGVAYGSDTKLVERLLLDCAKNQQGVLNTPTPFVLFEDFADSSLNFGLYFSVRDVFGDPKTKSDLRFKIDQKFRDNNISIPFPQRDLHVYNQGKEDTENKLGNE